MIGFLQRITIKAFNLFSRFPLQEEKKSGEQVVSTLRVEQLCQ